MEKFNESPQQKPITVNGEEFLALAFKQNTTKEEIDSFCNKYGIEPDSDKVLIDTGNGEPHYVSCSYDDFGTAFEA